MKLFKRAARAWRRVDWSLLARPDVVLANLLMPGPRYDGLGRRWWHK